MKHVEGYVPPAAYGAGRRAFKRMNDRVIFGKPKGYYTRNIRFSVNARLTSGKKRAIERGNVVDGTATINRVMLMLKEQKNKCRICAGDLVDGIFELDHVIPISKGGKHSIYNLQAVCEKCHAEKTVKDCKK